MQTVNNENIKVATSDGKNIEMDIAYNYVVQPDKVVDLFNKFGAVDVETIENTYLKTRLWDAARNQSANTRLLTHTGKICRSRCRCSKEIC